MYSRSPYSRKPRTTNPDIRSKPLTGLENLQESFSKFDKSLRLLEGKFQSNEINGGEDLLGIASEGEPAEWEARELLKELDIYDDEWRDAELTRRIDSSLES